MQEWMRLDPATLNRSFQERIRGVQINVLLSPYDVPLAVRGYFDKSLDRFVIEFKYLGDEPEAKRKLKQDENITLRVGQNSRRLLGIEVNVHRMEVRAVGLQMRVARVIKEALEDFVAREGTKPRSSSYRVAKAVIAERERELLGELPTQ